MGRKAEPRNISVVVDEKGGGERADSYVAKATRVSRSHLKHYVKSFTVNGREVKMSHSLKTGDSIEIELFPRETFSSVIREEGDLSIAYEDDSFIVVRKEPGVTVHPAFGHASGTLCNYVKQYLYGKGIEISDGGMVHRLDKDTEGLILFAKSLEMQGKLKELFAGREVEKKYRAIVKGRPVPGEGEFEDWLKRSDENRLKYTAADDSSRGKWAKLSYRVIGTTGLFSLVDIRLHTGRTHQIRVQFSSRGYPVVGDPIYSRSWKAVFEEYGMLLCSVAISFLHPLTKNPVSVSMDMPERFYDFMDANGLTVE